jgi:predicted AAA+ superfamily ATPase
MTDPLDRIADALERLAPPPAASADPLKHPAYVWKSDVLVATRAFVALPLEQLIGIDKQKAALVGNLDRLAHGFAAHDVLLWGARGTGKSALVKSAVADVQAKGGDLALVEVGSASLDSLPALFASIAAIPRAYARCWRAVRKRGRPMPGCW